VNIRDLDLNLLLVFNAIYVEKSISGAAKKLGLTQPAVSNALRRLRTFTGDPLFYKAGRGVSPTRAAESLAIPVGHALDTMERGLSSVRSFDPATSTRTFRIGTNDLVHSMLVPTLVGLVRRQAPNVVLEFIFQPHEGAVTALKEGAYDLAILPAFSVDEDLTSTHFASEQFVMVLGRNHPMARLNKLTVEAINNMHFVVTTHVPRLRKLVDDAFAANGATRNVVCAVGDTHSVYSLVAVSDLVSCVGRSVANQHNADGSLVLLDLPFDMPSIEGHMVWTKRMDDDQGHKWIRDYAVEIMRSGFKLHSSEA
jgi:DNA-binding transcriptional LysR family regulator